MVLRIVVGLVMTVAAAAIASRRLWWLGRLGRAVQPAPDRVAAVRSHPERDVEVQASEVFGQRKLLKWSIPGLAHLFTFWGFVVLIFTIIEAYGDLFSRTFAIPGIGHSFVLGFIEDLFAVLVLAGISGVVATLLLYRGAQINTGVFPYSRGAFASQEVGQECPVDIDHIDGMRRHQVLIESAFPVEAAGMLKNLENKGDPWGMGANRRGDWIGELDFEVPVAAGKIDDGIEYLFWVGCAGAQEDRAKKTTKAIAELLHTGGMTFAVLGPAETCTGDSARRIGNEFVFSMLAQQNIETLNEAAHQVVHHTQLLAKLVADGKLTPVGQIKEKITYHDPCFLGRHNKVYTPPREIIDAVPGTQAEEMHRCKSRGFCLEVIDVAQLLARSVTLRRPAPSDGATHEGGRP
jgi:hypothetical protein